MLLVRLLWALAATMTVATVLLFALHLSPATPELDSDLAEVRQRLVDARSEQALYSGGLIKSLTDMRVQTLELTQDALLQKRASFLRRIALTYTVKIPLDAEKAEIEAAAQREIEQAGRRADAARLEADQYSGGLIRSLALAKVATEELTLAFARLRLLTARYGLPMPPGLSPPTESAPTPAGRIVRDKEAL